MFVDDAKRGVRLWVRCTEKMDGREYRGSGPVPTTPRGHMGRIVYPRIIDPRSNKPTEIYGEAWFTNAEQVREIIKHSGGQVMFDPDEIVERGMMSAEEMTQLGYHVTASAKHVAPDQSPLREAMPDFDTMSKSELREWANTKGIFLDERSSKNAMIEKIKKEIK